MWGKLISVRARGLRCLIINVDQVDFSFHCNKKAIVQGSVYYRGGLLEGIQCFQSFAL